MIIISIINCQVQRDQRANLKQCRVASLRGVISSQASYQRRSASFQSISPQSSITTFLLVFPDLEPRPSIWDKRDDEQFWQIFLWKKRERKNYGRTNLMTHLFNNIHAVHNLTKNNMSPVQPFSFDWEQILYEHLLRSKSHTCANEKLAPICVRSCVGHGKNSGTLHEYKCKIEWGEYDWGLLDVREF